MRHLVLLVSDGIFHPPLAGRFWLQWGLAALPGYSFRRVASLEALPEQPLPGVQALVLYFHHKRLSPHGLETLENFVRQGGGLLAIHSASASFKEEERYYAILGGRFDHHGPVQDFQVRPAPGIDEIFGRVPPFTVHDELYRHAFDPANRIHFYTEIDGQQEPVVWTRSYGRGRVCYCSLGHCSATLRITQVQRILQHGLVWACGRAPSGSPPPPPSPEPGP